jgi:hypothetical protein
LLAGRGRLIEGLYSSEMETPAGKGLEGTPESNVGLTSDEMPFRFGILRSGAINKPWF